MPSKIYFDFQTLYDKRGENYPVIECSMCYDNDTTFPIERVPIYLGPDAKVVGQKITFIFNSKNKKLSGTYIIYYACDNQTVTVYRTTNDDRFHNNKYLVHKANYDIDFHRWSGSYEDPIYEEFGYYDN